MINRQVDEWVGGWMNGTVQEDMWIVKGKLYKEHNYENMFFIYTVSLNKYEVLLKLNPLKHL